MPHPGGKVADAEELDRFVAGMVDCCGSDRCSIAPPQNLDASRRR
jgi:hypothetical protein